MMMGASKPALRVSTAHAKDPLASASQAKRVRYRDHESTAVWAGTRIPTETLCPQLSGLVGKENVAGTETLSPQLSGLVPEK